MCQVYAYFQNLMGLPVCETDMKTHNTKKVEIQLVTTHTHMQTSHPLHCIEVPILNNLSFHTWATYALHTALARFDVTHHRIQ